MRRFLALARSAALEALAEPLSAVLFLVSLLTVHLVPVFHCHQFGAPERLPIECGFSALLVWGLVFATSAAVRSVGREIESGTAAVALARPVSRPLFFCAKCCGVFGAFFLFSVALASSTLLAAFSARVGALAAVEEGASRTWGPGVAVGIGTPIASFVLAALANRFFRMRFCVAACILMAIAQPLASALIRPLVSSVDVEWGVLSAFVVLFVGCSVFVALAGACAVRFSFPMVTAIVSVAVVLSFVWPLRGVIPDFSLFWLVDQMVAGNAMSAADILIALCSGAFLLGLWLSLGSILMIRRELP